MFFYENYFLDGGSISIAKQYERLKDEYLDCEISDFVRVNDDIITLTNDDEHFFIQQRIWWYVGHIGYVRVDNCHMDRLPWYFEFHSLSKVWHICSHSNVSVIIKLLIGNHCSLL